MFGLIAIVGWAGVAGVGLGVLNMLRQESRSDRVIGLLYHRVVTRERYDSFMGAERIFSIPEDSFEEQLSWLRDNGYHFLSVDELVELLSSERPIPERSVCVTFDDGCESVYSRALPILERLGIPAAVYVTVDEDAWIFQEGEYFERRMSIREVRECSQRGMTVGSHAVSHRGLNEMSRADVLRELVMSRELLLQWTGSPVRHFAVPLNFYNRETLELCRDAGYHSVCTSDNGTTNRDTDPYRIKRFIVEGSYDLAAFQRALTPRLIVQRRILNAMKKLPPKILGERVWMPLRERIFHSFAGRWLSFAHLRLALLSAGLLALVALVGITLLALA